MPYTLTEFPVRTNRPRIDVELPVGRHEFELVVRDSAGLESAADRIVIEVTKVAAGEPKIVSIDKVFGLPGERIDTYVRGENLREATDIRFERVVPRDAEGAKGEAAAKPGGRSRPAAAGRAAPATTDQLEARILAGGTENQLHISLRIPANAALGEYSFYVTTRTGRADSPLNFLVAAAPHIDNFGPSRTHLAETTEVTIEGQYLMVPTLEQPERVEIVDPADPDAGAVTGITVEIIKARSGPESVCATITVSAAAAPGEYRLRLTTPVGWTDAEDTFLVEQGRGR